MTKKLLCNSVKAFQLGPSQKAAPDRLIEYSKLYTTLGHNNVDTHFKDNVMLVQLFNPKLLRIFLARNRKNSLKESKQGENETAM